jgi:hypothetical protein
LLEKWRLGHPHNTPPPSRQPVTNFCVYLPEKPAKWLAIRGSKNSDAAAEREWEATELGQRETQLRWELKRIDKLSSAIASKLRVMEIEARNLVWGCRDSASILF